jgi:hypothetical protein
MSGTLVTAEMTEIKHVSNFKKLNHSLPLCQNIVNGIRDFDYCEGAAVLTISCSKILLVRFSICLRVNVCAQNSFIC